ncbi:uncharacterized protein LOC117885804 isoform X2 [Trachemys scripta elegans]|uniref:uncharacterized protein LOC117885804 isoform X2 n=1 Tax=Trachemys scripta elegans TaxID=31138 RepID=UPI0015552EED|nr:uncharacterized protein LOC117885804 isoform X2 [Trachemys scripta elegans]
MHQGRGGEMGWASRGLRVGSGRDWQSSGQGRLQVLGAATPERAARPGGGTGFVGGALTQLLRSRGHEVTHVSRHPGPDRISWDELSHSGLPPCDAVVNLAGGMMPSAGLWLPAGWRPPRPWPRPSLRPKGCPAPGSSSPA